MSLGEFVVQKQRKTNLQHSPNDIISANFDSKKLIKLGFFIIKIYHISSSNDPISHTLTELP
jgi:hypothetical protein